MDATITPETDLERTLLADPRVRAGLAWGAPRRGHPDGTVATHVAAILARIPADDALHADLRLLALLHDSFKHEVRPDERWSPENDHATRARRYAERHIADIRVLAALELHDEPYWIWRNAGAPRAALGPLLERVPDAELNARFVELDAATDGTDVTFLWWFRRELALAGARPRHRVGPSEDGPAADAPLVYVKAFAVDPDEQAEIARAAAALVAAPPPDLPGDGEVLSSDDGLRVLLTWRWPRSRADLLDRDGDFVRDALAAHPGLAEAEAVQARIYSTGAPA